MTNTKKANKKDIINIKYMPIQNHVGTYKIINDDWGTIAFVITRDQLQLKKLKFVDELRYKCIYFLFGYENNIEKAYVGQADKRNSGESVLARLSEHIKNVNEKYYEHWKWAVVLTNKDDTWTADDLKALEHAFYKEIPRNNNWNSDNPNSGGANYEAYTDKIKQIKSLVTAIGFNIFADTEDTEKIQVTSEINENTIVEDLQNGLARIPEIITPHKVVKEMVDMLPAEVWNEKTVFLDPACKGGEYLREIYDRLMDCEILQAKYQNEIERSNHILENQIFGIALSQVSLERTTKKLRGYSHNIKVIPDYINKLKGIGLGSRPDGSQKNMRDILEESFGKDIFKKDIREDKQEMKLNVIIGNPPYQENSGGGGRTKKQAQTIYHKFIENAINISESDIICMITKNNWLTSCSLEPIRKSMIETGIKYINNYSNYNEVFKGVSVSVCSFLCVKGYEKDTLYKEIVDSNIINQYTYNFKKQKICIPNNIEQLNIMRKIDAQTSKTFDSKVIGKMPFGIASDGKIGASGHGDYIEESVIQTKEYSVPILYKDGYMYTKKECVPKNSNLINQYKIICGQQLRKDSTVVYNIKGLNIGHISSQSFPVIFSSINKEEAYNAYKYINTKLFRLLVRCITDEICTTTPKRFKLVPLQDFTNNSDIDWAQSIAEIDKQLYKKYNLTQEEINYIESTIKPMK